MHLNEQITTKSWLWSFSDFHQLLKALRWLMLNIYYEAQNDTALPSDTHRVGLNNYFLMQMLEGTYLCKANSPSDTVPWVTPADRPTRRRNARRAGRVAGDRYFSQYIGDCLYSPRARKWKLFQTYNNRGWKQLCHQLFYVQRFTADFTAELTATSRRWIHPRISYFKRKRDRLQTT